MGTLPQSPPERNREAPPSLRWPHLGTKALVRLMLARAACDPNHGPTLAELRHQILLRELEPEGALR